MGIFVAAGVEPTAATPAEDRSIIAERVSEPTPGYRSIDVALLRAAAVPLTAAGDTWPDLADAEACRAWLVGVWGRRDVVEAVRQASPSLADRVDIICAGGPVGARQVRRAAATLVRYVLRASGRPTPFGLFAGVAPVTFAQAARGRWGSDHRPVARVNTEWLADVIDGLEACPDLLVRLKVAFCDLTVRRGGRIELARGPRRATIRCTTAVDAVRDAAATPVRFDSLVHRLGETFTPAARSAVRGMLGELVRQGFLVTELRAPFTVTDPLAHVVDRLRAAGGHDLPSIAQRLRELEAVQAAVTYHNHEAQTRAEQARARAAVSHRMRRMSRAGRTALVVDLRLDCEVRVPRHVADELAKAAGALLRLSRQPVTDPAWREFHAAFCDRYGTGTLVPLGDVIDPDSGLGYPAGYPGSVLTMPPEVPSERDEGLLALALEFPRFCGVLSTCDASVAGRMGSDAEDETAVSR